MRSWKSAVLRRICAMFGNRCYFYHRLFPMELISTIPAIMIILITVIIGTRVEAIRFADPFPSSSSSVISSGHSGPEAILARIRIRRNASNYFVKRLRSLASNSRKDMKSNDLQVNDIRNANDISRRRFIVSDLSTDQNIPINRKRFTKLPSSSDATVEDNNQNQMLRKKSKLPQQTQHIASIDSLPAQTPPKLIPSKFPRFTSRRDCNGSDCLRNNDAISLYIPENNTKNGQLPPLLLISNNHSNNSNRENHNLQQGTTLKLPELHTGIKILESNIHQPQKLGPLPPSDVSYHVSQTNSKNYDEYGSVKSAKRGPIPPPIPPFAGGAQLTDFIQPIDTVVQTRDVYENIIPNHISSGAYYSKNKPYLFASENRGLYDNFESKPLIPFDSKLEVYEPVTASPTFSAYSSYSDQNTDYFTSSPHYEPPHDLYSVSFNFN
ncbi:unnamed protein product [Onchocerca flexuosa]|uniref:Homeobox protein 2-like n=1 Tax=Onchocerca flexuosa TaxID=387005 RepID=A0A183I7E0_9BILA|nr:unnamed protein product [Onchocerca flexuosa]